MAWSFDCVRLPTKLERTLAFRAFGKSAVKFKVCSAVVLCLVSFSVCVNAQQGAWSRRVAQGVIQGQLDNALTASDTSLRSERDLGILLEGMDAVWYNSADRQYFKYVRSTIDKLVLPDGSIPTYESKSSSLDELALGHQLLWLYRATLDKRYYKAAAMLRQQLLTQPKTASGGYWYGRNFPNQMWLDGLYMAEPFFAEYASVFQEPQDFAEITQQFVLIEQRARDSRTGLIYHGWDESKQQFWANRGTGASASYWARGMGWYMMALIDSLPYYPQDDPGRPVLLAILNRMAAATIRYQDRGTGLWYQVLDKPSAQGNYLESSAACMFTYVLAKGVRLGYLPRKYSENAERAWAGMQSRFLRTDASGAVVLAEVSPSVSVDEKDSSAGSYKSYVSAPATSNGPVGIGALLLASSEMELGADATLGLGKKVLLDAWFNSQKRTNAAGQTEYFHYKWSDYSNPGFSIFGHMLRNFGLATDTLYTAPTADNLKDAQFYVIVSPDNPAKNPDPHYMTEQDAGQIAAWVKAGGVLLMFENDPDNADITHLDLLADKFGLHFNNALTHHVIDNDIRMGRIEMNSPGEPFTASHVLYMKDTCSLALSGNAAPLLRYKDDILMAKSKYGKGTVIAVADPWLYNEYTDGRILPPEYDNYAAGKELVRWLLQQR